MSTVRNRELLKHGRQRVRGSGLFVPLLAWSLAGLTCWYYVGDGLLSPLGNRIPLDLQALRPGGLFVLISETLLAARQSGWLAFAALVFAVRLALSPAVEAWVYHRLSGGGGSPAWRGFYQLSIVLFLAAGLIGWVLYSHSASLLSMLSAPLPTLGWLLIILFGFFLAGLALTWYKLVLAGRARLLWPRLGKWLKLAWLQLLLSLMFALLMGCIQYLSPSADGIVLIILLVVASIVRLYGKLWKMACSILVLQER